MESHALPHQTLTSLKILQVSSADLPAITHTSPDESSMYKFIDREQLERADLQWHQSGSTNELLEQLFDVLIRPIQGFLDESAPSPDQCVVFVPHAVLTRVPFAALRDRDRPASPWLIQRHMIAVAPSIRVLKQCTQWWHRLRKCRPPLADSLVVGNPSPMPFHNCQLPEAEKEAQSLAGKLQYALL